MTRSVPRMPGRRVVLCLLALALSGCADLAPRDPPPALPVPNAWPVAPASPAAVAPATLAWQSYFRDPALAGLIETALANSRDLRMALLRVEEARAQYGVRRAGELPEVAANAQASRAGVPGDLNPSGGALVSSEYAVQAGLSHWELDLWGRVRNLSQSALQTYLATEAAARAARIALIAEVAHAYAGLRELDARAVVARETITSREATLRMFQRRHAVGAVSLLELAQVETLVHQARRLGLQLDQARAAQANALALLAGSPVDLSREVTHTLDFPPLAPGLPSDLLAQRPDIMAAEHRLRASQANVGAARAAFFPRIALTGGLGTASAELGGLFASGSRAWTFAPTISLPLFDGGRRSADLSLAEARRDIAVADYEKTIQTAFREVADALSAQQWLRRQVGLQRDALAVLAERARLAELRYDSGAASYLEVLDAQRDLLDARQQFVQLERQLHASQITLYAALGGGAPSSIQTP